MAVDKPILVSTWPSAYCHRVQIALAEKGVQYEYVEADLANKSSLLLQFNPIHKKVPVLIHGGKSVCESLNIVEYIDEVWTESPPLLPRDPHQRASARFWADFANKMYDSTRMMVRAVEQVAPKQEFTGQLKLLEGELGDKDYFGGDTFGYVDVALAPTSCWFYAIDKFVGLNMEEECPKCMAWVKRCMERESVSKTLPSSQKMYEYICSLAKKLPGK